MANISFYGSHNASVVVENNGEIVTVIEIERFLNQKNAGYSQYLACWTRPQLLTEILKFIEKEYGISEYENCYYLNSDTVEVDTFVFYHELIPAKNYIGGMHHLSHAADGFYQTDYKSALIISFDGGGNDGFFNVYYAKNRREINLIDKYDIDLGFAYMIFGEYLGDIRKEPALNIGNLVYSGKIMGLCSYGKVIEEWLPHFKEFYLSKPDGNNYEEYISILGDKIGLTFDVENRFEGQKAWDIAKTSQVAFEEIFLDMAQPYFKKYPKAPLIVVGGCALNIILNTRLKEELERDVFVPPNPNDCGIATGMMLYNMKPSKAVDITYAGVPILDSNTLMAHVEERRGFELDINQLVEDLSEGRIVGVARSTSEHGPRALGNRSIICDPTYPDMKDILNAKVKNREWYRPFAPVCRLEDVSEYFDFEGESRWMSFCPTVKEEWRDKLVSITHVDGTARVQTVTQEQNPWLYNLITEFKKKTGVGVLLNTSFNVNGRPILSRFSDALKVYDQTEMDCLLLEDFYFRKRP
jgi:carbamoyltransferase